MFAAIFVPTGVGSTMRAVEMSYRTVRIIVILIMIIYGY